VVLSLLCPLQGAYSLKKFRSNNSKETLGPNYVKCEKYISETEDDSSIACPVAVCVCVLVYGEYLSKLLYILYVMYWLM